MNYFKIHIIGPAGSGKTTLAKRFARNYGIAHLNMDDIFWNNSDTCFVEKFSDEKRDALLIEFLNKNSSYIVEGSYYKWGFESWRSADVVIFLIPSFSVTLFRLMRRYFRRRLGFEKPKESSLLNFIEMIMWNWRWYKRISEFHKLVESYNSNVFRCETVEDVERLLFGQKKNPHQCVL